MVDRKRNIRALYTLLILPILSFSQSHPLDKCRLVPSINDFSNRSELSLSHYWAQEYTGSDLLREKFFSEKVKVNPNIIEILDIGKMVDSHHGEYVSSLIISEFPSAVLPHHKDRKCFEFSAGFLNADGYSLAVDHCLRNPDLMYMNNSLAWFNEDEKVAEEIRRISDEKRGVVITSAGNESKRVNNSKRKLSRENHLIIVSSVNNLGQKSYYTNFASEVDISAPSADNILSFSFSGKPVLFSGTSASAPQVTSALAAFSTMTNYKLTTIEAKRLLKKTAIKNPNFPNHKVFGAGILNTYKIGMIGFKLRRMCLDNIGKSYDKCIKQKLKEDSLFIFDNEKKLQELRAKVSSIFFDNPSQPSRSVCLSKKRLLKEFREEVLLSSGDITNYTFLGKIYYELGYKTNASFYYSLSKRVDKNEMSLIKKILNKQKPYSQLKIAFADNHFLKKEKVLKLVKENYLDHSLLSAFADNISDNDDLLKILLNTDFFSLSCLYHESDGRKVMMGSLLHRVVVEVSKKSKSSLKSYEVTKFVENYLNSSKIQVCVENTLSEAEISFIKSFMKAHKKR